MSNPSSDALIGPEQAQWLQRPLSIIVGSRDAQLRPHLMRAVGARLSADRRQLCLLMPRAHADALCADIEANGQVAVVFSEPHSDRTLQIKGQDARLSPCQPEDAALAEQHLQGFVGEIGQLGFPAEVAHTVLRAGSECLRIEFTVGAVFEQTPGPGAGAPAAAQ
ncbi:pyridoxamine 5'-phosphate oxidase family protein [Inhella sp.]|uniref:pyridoxamine 5'-phosphate oxidase family protein n=1 Tax=Inhella sp. TaxID=1921806 RepID=UPI0035B45C55